MWLPSIALTTCGNGDLFVNKRMLCSTSCSVAGNLINSVARLAIASQKSCVINIAVHLPMPNCSPVDLYVSPVARRHNATATRLFTWIHWRNLVSLFVKSGPTTRTMYSNVRLDIMKFSFHQSSTKSPCKRLSNQNWFRGHAHARLARLVFFKAIWSKTIRFRLDLLRCCNINILRNRDVSVCDSWIKK